MSDPAWPSADAAPAPSPESEHGAGPVHGMVISLESVRAGYGGIEVLHDVRLFAGPGDVCALLGPNGAGKSTTLRVVSGRLAVDGGLVVIDGAAIRKPQPARLAADGMCCIPEGRGVFPNLTVEEHVSLWSSKRRAQRRELMDVVAERFPVLGSRRRQLAGSLSGGERQMLALSRSLRPGVRALVCDELSMGLAPKIVEELYGFLAGLARAGVTVIVVEQFADMVLSIATRASVLVGGRVRLAGSPQEVRAGLHDAYLGGASEVGGAR
jgi:branched-chain amino acid transport system ATP-binding protein